MAKNRKLSFRFYSAWNYEKEIEDLNAASEKGWQLENGGCFHSSFVRNPDIRYRYQMDYRRIDNMGRYLETFREQGWEYVNSTFNGWHYFRRIYDPALPEETYEIFTDRQSLREMNNRWARLALIMGAVLAALAVFSAVRLILHATLPTLIQTLLFAIESAVLIRGGLVMRDPDASRSRRYDSLFLALLLAVLLAGATSSITLSALRVNFTTDQRAESVNAPFTDQQCGEFEIRYRDSYYLDLDLEAAEPMTLTLFGPDGKVVYTVTESDFHRKNIRMTLPRGKYTFSIDVTSGYHWEGSLD